MQGLQSSIHEAPSGNGILQGSPEWKALRIGKVTGSRIADVMAKSKSGWGASRANYMADLVCERLTGTPTEAYASPAMKHGTENEPQARAAYEFLRDATVEQVAFVAHPTIAMSGCSPDGLVGRDGLVEFKCPLSATHMETLLGGSIPGRYRSQMLWQMACCERQWCDFVSYDPRMPPEMQLAVVRIDRDPAAILDIEVNVANFLGEVTRTVAELEARYLTRQEAA